MEPVLSRFRFTGRWSFSVGFPEKGGWDHLPDPGGILCCPQAALARNR